MDNLSKEFSDSLFINISDVGIDYLELGVDAIINNDIIKEIPIVKSIVSVLKISKSIHDRNLLKQTLIFIEELNRGTIDEDKYEVYKESINNNHKKCEEELGRVLILLNGFIDKEKSIMLAKLFKAYVNKNIDWDNFCEYSEIINRLFIQDIRVLRKLKNEEIDKMYSREDAFRVDRLESLGLVGIIHKETTYGDLKDDHINMVRGLSPIGYEFYRIILDD